MIESKMDYRLATVRLLRMKRQFEKRSSFLREMGIGTRQIQELLADSVREMHDLDSETKSSAKSLGARK